MVGQKTLFERFSRAVIRGIKNTHIIFRPAVLVKLFKKKINVSVSNFECVWKCLPTKTQTSSVMCTDQLHYTRGTIVRIPLCDFIYARCSKHVRIYIQGVFRSKPPDDYIKNSRYTRYGKLNYQTNDKKVKNKRMQYWYNYKIRMSSHRTLPV